MRIPGLALASLAIIAGLVGGLALSSAPALAEGPPEAPLTEAATGVTGVAARFNGTLNPKTKSKVGWYFAYAPEGACTGGLTTPAQPEVEIMAEKVQIEVTGLRPSTKYTVCLVATSASGEVIESTSGLPVSFTTRRAKPTVDVESSSSVTPFAAVLETSVNPNKQDTTCKFEYGTTKAYGTSLPCEPADLGGGFGDQSASSHLAGLEPSRTYFYRVVAENATGVAKGEGGEFATLPLERPVVAGEGASNVTASGSTLEAQINPNYQETTYHFEYATNETLAGAVVVAGGNLPAGFFEEGEPTGPVHSGDLEHGTTYYYRVVADNAAGSATGIVQSFTTIGLPLVNMEEAQSPTRTTVKFVGTIAPELGETFYHFVYIDQVGYEAALAESAFDRYAKGRSTSSLKLDASGETVAVGPIMASELRSGTVYHYALIATNAAGTTIGQDVTFSTAPATPPLAVTGTAGEVTQTAAMLAGTVDTRGVHTIYDFELGTTAGTYLPEGFADAGSVAGSQAVSSQLSNLAPSVSYHYRLCATNQDGTTCGEDQSLTTMGIEDLPALAAVSPLIVPPPESLGRLGVLGTTTSNTLTRAQRLSRALRACGRKPRNRRASCEKQAHKKYGTAKKTMPSRGKGQRK